MFGFGFNSNVTLTAVGRLGKDPEKKTFGEGEKARTRVAFSIAVDEYNPKEPKKPNTLWIKCSVFNDKAGGMIMEYVKKGAILQVTGTPKLNSWTDKEGNSRTDLELSAEHVVKVWSAKEEKTEEAPEQSAAASGPADDGSDIPF